MQKTRSYNFTVRESRWTTKTQSDLLHLSTTSSFVSSGLWLEGKKTSSFYFGGFIVCSSIWSTHFLTTKNSFCRLFLHVFGFWFCAMIMIVLFFYTLAKQSFKRKLPELLLMMMFAAFQREDTDPLCLQPSKSELKGDENQKCCTWTCFILMISTPFLIKM